MCSNADRKSPNDASRGGFRKRYCSTERRRGYARFPRGAGPRPRTRPRRIVRWKAAESFLIVLVVHRGLSSTWSDRWPARIGRACVSRYRKTAITYPFLSHGALTVTQKEEESVKLLSIRCLYKLNWDRRECVTVTGPICDQFDTKNHYTKILVIKIRRKNVLT